MRMDNFPPFQLPIRFQDSTKIIVVLEVDRRFKILPLCRRLPEHALQAHFFLLRGEVEEGGIPSFRVAY